MFIRTAVLSGFARNAGVASVRRPLLVLVACSVFSACADSGAPSTLVRFERARPVARWNISRAADAGPDAELADAAISLDGGELDAQEPAEDEDAGPLDASVDGGSEEQRAKPITACTLRLTTKSQGGRYAPKNIGAIWVEREDGTWIKTLRVWAGVRLRYLSTYLKANTARNTMDATTSATQRQHGAQEARWNLSDGEGEPAPDGEYQIRVEVTDRDAIGQVLTIPFSKSGEAVEMKPEDNEFFTGVELNCN